MRIFHFLLIGMCLALSATANAASLSIANSSFEDPVTNPATFSGNTAFGPSGWTVYNTIAANTDRYFGVWNPATTTSYIGGAPDGNNIGVVFLDNDLSEYVAEAGLRQTLGDTLQLSTQYTLTVEVGNFAPSVGDPWDFTGFPGYRVELLAGGVVIAVDNNTLTPGEGVFLTSTVSFTTGLSHANAGQTLSIRLVNLNGPGVEVNFDDVRLDATAVPEPSSALLFGFGVLAALRMRRRTR